METQDQPPAGATNLPFLVDHLADGIIVLNANDQIVFLNSPACALLGGRREVLLGQSASSVFPSRYELSAWLESPISNPREVKVNDDPLLVMEMTITLLPSGFGLENARLITLRDITHKKLVEDNLRERESLYYNLFLINQDAIIITDLNSLKIVDCNQSACEMNGFTHDELVGRHINTLHGKESSDLLDDPTELKQRLDLIRRNHVFRSEAIHRTRDGSEFIIETCMSLATLHGQEFLLGIDRDITARKRSEMETRRANEQLEAQLVKIQSLQEQLNEQVVRDSLTGLYNRRLLDETIQREIARSDRSGKPFSLLMVDTDHFKMLNDMHGHQAGDLVLTAIGELLTVRFRKMDTTFRFGGEEFLIILPESNLETARERAEALREALAALRVPYEEKNLQITASIGVVCYPDHAHTTDTLLQAADNAMYQAKNTGRNRVCCAS
jgi:diguanylate cyclase (GGDEF)-like protein/PAS domain S-box-containing protein